MPKLSLPKPKQKWRWIKRRNASDNKRRKPWPRQNKPSSQRLQRAVELRAVELRIVAQCQCAEFSFAHGRSAGVAEQRPENAWVKIGQHFPPVPTIRPPYIYREAHRQRSPYKVLKTPYKVLKTPCKVLKTPYKVLKTPCTILKTPCKVLKLSCKVLNYMQRCTLYNPKTCMPTPQSCLAKRLAKA